MSVQAMSWALSQQIVTESCARHVLLCLANYADQDGRAAFPSVPSLANDTGLSPRTIQYRLRELEEIGLIMRGNQAIAAAYINQRDRLPVCYDLALQQGAQHAPGARHDVAGREPEQNRVHVVTERGARRAPNPPINHPLTTLNQEEGISTPVGQGRKRKAQGFDPLTARPANASEKAWIDFCDMRKAKRAPLTLRACELIATKLASHPDPDAVLDRSTLSSWTDIYPDSVLSGAGAKRTKPISQTRLDQIDYEVGLEQDADGHYWIGGNGQ